MVDALTIIQLSWVRCFHFLYFRFRRFVYRVFQKGYFNHISPIATDNKHDPFVVEGVYDLQKGYFAHVCYIHMSFINRSDYEYQYY